VLEQPKIAVEEQFANNVARVRNREALDRVIDSVFGAQTLEALKRKLSDAGIAFGKVNDVAGLAAHPQLRTWPVSTPSGEVQIVAPPLIAADDEERFGAVPRLGEHDQEIRREFS
jgi:itaconate CoA-transferase